MTAIEFLRRYRPNSLVKSSARGEYQLAEHDSFKINGESSVWHWKSRNIGGKSALKYLIYVEGVPFVEAVQLLCEESPTYIPVQHEAVERERPLFRLPNPAPNNDRVTRYLLGRGVSLSAIRYCIERKILYESAEYHNCVFLGKDPQGVPKYAALRGIYDYGKPFKREAPGSQKQYGFCIPPMQPGTTVAVFEAAIDAMAEMTLCGDAADKYRLSLGGISSSGKEPLALQEFLRQHPEITTIELRLDNDAKGRMASVGIRKIYADRYTVHDLPPNIKNGDYADSVRGKVVTAIPSVEVHGNKLCGCLTVELKEPLLDDEQTVLCNYISGQYSDGWGEGFEQRDIRVDDGTLAVHFWQENGFKMTPSFEKIPKPEKNSLRPKMQLLGQDGNIFAIMGRASRLLKSSGQGDKAKEMRDRVMSCDSYQKALNIVSEYVETELSPSPTPKRDRGDAR